jgi:hypothetical protein
LITHVFVRGVAVSRLTLTAFTTTTTTATTTAITATSFVCCCFWRNAFGIQQINILGLRCGCFIARVRATVTTTTAAIVATRVLAGFISACTFNVCRCTFTTVVSTAFLTFWTWTTFAACLTATTFATRLAAFTVTALTTTIATAFTWFTRCTWAGDFDRWFLLVVTAEPAEKLGHETGFLFRHWFWWRG